ncbi:choice-of-anchor L domain-containing protein, partial [Winogradskyella sp.]|uniref:choice-of-anchor L domain-containing protein n=1 Tax=Winogradskyella sp. TaxID=1883156 RepID=UPI0035C820C4
MRLNKTYAFLVCYCCFGLNLIAQQISVDNTLSVQQLVETTFTQECVEITNINSSINGNVIGIGSFGVFTQDASNFPFENGMILTTGNASSAGNTVNTEVLNEGEETWGTDSDLENTLGITETENATSIEFDFTSISNSLQINYILASEEYFSNFPCQYSDGFALLIREAGSGNPYVNIAVVPGTNTTVNTTTIHDEIDGFCQEENSQFFDGYNIGDTNYNGRTTT